MSLLLLLEIIIIFVLILQVSVNRSGKSKVIFTMGVARDFCTKLTSFANFLAQGRGSLQFANF